jgi:hypothetical protein
MLTAEKEGASTMATAIAARRELAHRASNGIEVSLYWSKPTNRVTVEVFDERFDEWFEFEIDGRDALDAFNHPFAYAASRGVPTTAAEALAA